MTAPATPLSDIEIQRELGALSGLDPEGQHAHAHFRVPVVPCGDRVGPALSEIAELRDHHPDIDIRYTKITLCLSTHSAGGITAKDFELARGIEAL